MNRVETVPHLRVAFRQLSEEGRKGLAAELRDIAMDMLRPLTLRITRPLRPALPQRYRAAGPDLGWDLRQTEDVLEFCALARRDAAVSLLERRACDLLSECTRALISDSVNEKLIESILDAYAACDVPAIETGRRFTLSRRPKSAGPVRKKIAALLTKSPGLKNSELWASVSRKPPRGWTFIPTTGGGWLDGPTADQHMSKRRFENVCGEERKKLKA